MLLASCFLPRKEEKYWGLQDEEGFFLPSPSLVPMVVAIVWGERKGRGRGRGGEGKGREGGRPVGTSYQGAREGVEI